MEIATRSSASPASIQMRSAAAENFHSPVMKPHRLAATRPTARLSGHPIAGDRLYGGPAAPRLMLHAERLTLPATDGAMAQAAGNAAKKAGAQARDAGH